MAKKQIVEKEKKVQSEPSTSDIFLDLLVIYIMLPKNDKNLVGYSRYLSELTGTKDWHNAKQNFDLSAANQVINQVWTPKKTNQLQRMHAGSSIILLTVPSTSGKNAIPIQLSKKLSTALKTKYFVGDQYFDSVHSQASKYIKRYERIFSPRKYLLTEKDLKKDIGKKELILIDDVLTSGGSVAQLVKTLNKQNIKVRSVVALMGEKRLRVDEKTQARLNEALKSLNISVVSSEQINDMALTRAEAGGLIQMIKAKGSKNAKNRIAGKIQRLFYGKTIANMGRTTKAGRNASAGTGNKNNERFSERIQTRPILNFGGTETGIKKIMSDFDRLKPNNLKEIRSYERAIIRSSATSAQKKQALQVIYNYKKSLKLGKGIGL
ncbi:MAG: phosphoribosyltransferase [Deltaproteobacteria bacterium]|nr:phosphoribosyltransferase [Deltaproteobacteria bacterium]